MKRAAMNKYKSLPVQVRAAFWFFACSVLQKGISTITTPIFTRLLSTEEYGNYSVFNSWLGIVSVIVTFSLANGVGLQGMIKYNDRKDTFLSSLEGLLLTLVALWTVVYMLFRDFWNQLFSLSTVQMTALLIIAWTTAVFDIWASEQRVRFSYRRLVALTLLISIIKPIIEIYFVIHAQDKVTARVLGTALVQIVGYSGLFVSQVLRGRRLFDAGFWKYAVLFSIPLIPQSLAEIVLGGSDRIMISKMVGDSQAGIYSLAYSLSLIMTILSSALRQTMSPWIYQRLKEKRLDDIAPIATFALILVSAANLMLIAIAPEAVKLFAPAKYYEAIWAIPPISMSVVAMFLCNLFAKLEFYYEKTYFVMIGSLGAAVANVLLNYIFIPRCGYYAAAYTTLVCFFMDAAGHYVFMRKIAKQYLSGASIYNIKVILLILLGFLVLGFGLMLLYSNAIVRYALIVLFALGILLNYKRVLKMAKRLFHFGE